jgi:hypothetical protein
MKVRTIQHGRITERPRKHPEHLARLATLPCVACGAWPVEVHHVVGYAHKAGRAPKRDDRVTPLCAFCHRISAFAVHAIGHRTFYEAHGVDLMAEAERLWEESNEQMD